jgi:hypothetical protein
MTSIRAGAQVHDVTGNTVGPRQGGLLLAQLEAKTTRPRLGARHLHSTCKPYPGFEVLLFFRSARGTHTYTVYRQLQGTSLGCDKIMAGAVCQPHSALQLLVISHKPVKPTTQVGHYKVYLNLRSLSPV